MATRYFCMQMTQVLPLPVGIKELKEICNKGLSHVNNYLKNFNILVNEKLAVVIFNHRAENLHLDLKIEDRNNNDM